MLRMQPLSLSLAVFLLGCSWGLRALSSSPREAIRSFRTLIDLLLLDHIPMFRFPRAQAGLLLHHPDTRKKSKAHLQ